MPLSNRVRAHWLRWPMLLLAATVLATLHIRCSYNFLPWEDFMSFQGEHPYQTRILPILVAKLVRALPGCQDVTLIRIFWLFDIAMLVAAMRAMQWLSRAPAWAGQVSAGRVMGLWAWQMVVTFVLSSIHNWYYPYDMASQAFTVIGLCLIVGGAPWVAVCAWTVLAAVNRETAVLLPLWAWAWAGWGDRRTMLRALSLMGGVALIKVSLAWATGGLQTMAVLRLPGTDDHWRLALNLGFVLSPAQHWHTANVFLAFGGVWVLLCRRGPAFAQADALRRMGMTFWPFLLIMAFAANLSEIRVFAEFFPLVAVLAAMRWQRRPQAPTKHLTAA